MKTLVKLPSASVLCQAEDLRLDDTCALKGVLGWGFLAFLVGFAERECEIELEGIVAVHSIGPDGDINGVAGVQRGQRPIKWDGRFAGADDFWTDHGFVDIDAQIDVSVELCIGSDQVAVGDDIETAIGDGE